VARIVTVYASARRPFVPTDMSYIRWLKMSEALAAMGHTVDIATYEPGRWRRFVRVPMGPRLRRVALGRVRWDRYDVVKTLFHQGFETLETFGGARHPFIVSKLGSVVGPEDTPAVYFHGEVRQRLFETQQRIAATSRYVTVLTEPSRRRWQECFDDRGNVLLVPGAADARLPRPGPDPYERDGWRRCLFAGNIYSLRAQPAANQRLTASLNALGRRLVDHRIRLYFLGGGDTTGLDANAVRSVGAVAHERAWDYMRAADVGLVLALGGAPNENESTKIYHYLRVGLPVVCESGFPNERLVTDLAMGEVVANGDVDGMAAAVARVAGAAWDRDAATAHVLAHHTWDARAATYAPVIARACATGS
jgi:glycosyltransferase involved in cell wall biosynthesis